MTFDEYVALSEERRLKVSLQAAQSHVPGTGRAITAGVTRDPEEDGEPRVEIQAISQAEGAVTVRLTVQPPDAADLVAQRMPGPALRVVNVIIGDETHSFHLSRAKTQDAS